MKVLHLFSNYKWTGPAEPALSLCCGLRALGVDVAFACAPDSGKFFNKVVASARERGVEPILDFHLRKHRHPLKNFQDVRRLRRYLAENAVDIVHCHLDNDHEIAARALRGTRIPLVRTSYEGTGLAPDRRRRAMLARTTLLIEPSEMARTHDRAAYTLRPEQIVVIPNAIDTKRFDPDRPLKLRPLQSEDRVSHVANEDTGEPASVIPANAGIQERESENLEAPLDSRFRGNDAAGSREITGERANLEAPLDSRLRGNDAENPRARWNLPPDAYTIGIVARMQTHRHFEDLLQAMRGVVDELPHAHLIIVGRGTHQESVANEPVRRLGLENHVTFTGYVEDDDYVAAIAAMDVGVYLVPGSDGTCRAAREILAMGKPLVVADRGMLREIVGQGACGVVTDGSPDALRDALLALGRDTARRLDLGASARQLAATSYALEAQAAAVREACETLLRGKKQG